MTTLIRQIAKAVPDLLGPAALVLIFGLAGCGGGGTGGTGQTAVPPGPIVITVVPSTVTINAGVPTTFTVSGGTAPYQVVSSNLPVIPDNGLTSQTGSFSITAKSVSIDTVVTLTFQDSAGHSTTALVTVRAAVLSVIPSTVTITSGIATHFTVSAG